MTIELDSRDRSILRILQADGRITNSDLAENVHLSPSACLRRLRLLERQGTIRGYTVVVEEAPAWDAVTVICLPWYETELDLVSMPLPPACEGPRLRSGLERTLRPVADPDSCVSTASDPPVRPAASC